MFFPNNCRIIVVIPRAKETQPVTDIQALLEEFRQFALSRVNESKNEIELDDLMLQWYDSKDAELINATIRQGISDMDAGLGKPADVISHDLRSKFGFPAK